MIVGCMTVAMAFTMMSCGDKSNPVAPVAGDASVPIPAGVTTVFSEGFGGDLSNWDKTYMINVGDFYSPMRITTAAFHTGTHSITSDSNRSALQYELKTQIIAGTVGIQFYIMASAVGQTNFTVEFGQNAGSSGGLGKAFGIGFDKSDSIKTVYYDTYLGLSPEFDSTIAPIQPGHWYKCAVEVNLDAAASPTAITWYIDGAKIQTRPLPTQELYGIDRLLVFRGIGGAEGPKPYYADDIVLYTK
jgi:hypothetical protein